MTLRILIVDDEPLAREGVALQLREAGDVEIVGECGNGSEAIEAIRALRPDLVFLDIKMPKVGGFDVIAKVGAAAMPLVIFLTAYDEYAVQAFRANALDYLLKPLDKAQFHESLQRARLRLEQTQAARQTEQLERLMATLAAARPNVGETPPRIAVKLSGQVQFLHPDELNWVEAEGDYVRVHTLSRAHLVKETMQAMERRLEPYGFLRIHRSAIVNLNKIDKLLATDNGDYEVLLGDGVLLKVGRNYRETLFARMQLA
ncbi:MAG TPA: response regulator [Hyphomicrobiales bacterium]|nr:response regulator [Hyphomicrobiales bacterium]